MTPKTFEAFKVNFTANHGEGALPSRAVLHVDTEAPLNTDAGRVWAEAEIAGMLQPGAKVTLTGWLRAPELDNPEYSNLKPSKFHYLVIFDAKGASGRWHRLTTKLGIDKPFLFPGVEKAAIKYLEEANNCECVIVNWERLPQEVWLPFGVSRSYDQKDLAK